jgi:hypothetical protein
VHLNRRGRNRWVILTRRYAFKFPAPTSWRDLLYGLLNNMNEADWSHLPGRCPVHWAAPGGLLIVMPRARTLTEEEFHSFDSAAFCAVHGIVAEHKPDSFGWLGDRVVAVDYGWS